MDSRDHGEDKSGMSSTKEDSTVMHEPAADPDEDDLDDLDGILDDFAPPVHQTSTQKHATGPQSAPEVNHQDADPLVSEALSKDLQEQMAALMGSMEDQASLKNVSENLSTGQIPSQATPAHQQSSTSEGSFQETIRKTMERMQASETQAESDGRDENVDDLLSQVLKEMGDGVPPEGEDEEGLNKMLLGMMEQLTNKDILYDPMKELHDKFPSWLEKNKATTKPEDFKRFEEQQKVVGEIVARFDRKEYSDSSTDDRDYIVDRMQKMQAAGSPPADLVGGMEAAEALGDMDSTCAQQ